MTQASVTHLRKKYRRHWWSWWLAIIIFLIPSNLFLNLNDNWGYVNGLRIDYLIPKLYLVDLVIIPGWLIGGYQKRLLLINWLKAHFNKLKWLVWWLVILAIRQRWSDQPQISYWWLGKLILIGSFGLSLKLIKNSIHWSVISWAILITLLFQSTLAIYQYHWQQSWSSYYFLGEPNLTNQLGLAKSEWGSVEKILPYGTTPHPNILGGLIVVYWLVLWQSVKKTRLSTGKFSFMEKGFTYLSLPISAYALWLTQSFSAWLAAIILLGSIAINFSKSKSHRNINRLLSSILTGTNNQIARGFLNFFYRKKLNLGKINQSFLLILSWGLIFWISPLIIDQLSSIVPDQPSFTRRTFLNHAAQQIFIDHPIWGVGLNKVTAQLASSPVRPEIVRFIQPSHHLGWLWLAETGIFGLLPIIIYWRLFTHFSLTKWWVLLPLLILDHYLLTQPVGWLMVVAVLVLHPGGRFDTQQS